MTSFIRSKMAKPDMYFAVTDYDADKELIQRIHLKL